MNTPEAPRDAALRLASAKLAEGFELQGLFSWDDESGNPLFWRIRLKHPDTGEKWIRPMHLNGQGYVLREPKLKTKKPLYGLSNAVRDPSAQVWVVEGEPKVDKLKSLGLCSVTSGAADSANSVDWSALQGRDIVIWRDFDDAGRRYASEVIAILQGLGCCVELLAVERLALPPRGDCIDWCATNPDKGKEEIENLPVTECGKNNAKADAHIKDAGDWLEQSQASITPVIEEIFDVGDKVAIIGKSKTRKSFFALQLALCVATGRAFLGYRGGDPSKVLLSQFEIREAHFHRRLKRMCEALGIEPSELKGQLLIVNGRGKIFSEDALMSTARDFGPKVIILDPLYKLMAGEENNVEDFKPILASFDRIAEELSASVAYVHHDRKGMVGLQDLSDRGAGSGVLGRDFDASFILTAHEDDGLLVLETLTRNYPPRERCSIEWLDHRFIESTSVPAVRTLKSATKRNKASIDEWTSTAIEMLRQSGAKMGVGVFKERLSEKGATRSQCSAIYDELRTTGRIVVESQKAGRGVPSKVICLSGSSNGISLEAGAFAAFSGKT